MTEVTSQNFIFVFEPYFSSLMLLNWIIHSILNDYPVKWGVPREMRCTNSFKLPHTCLIILLTHVLICLTYNAVITIAALQVLSYRYKLQYRRVEFSIIVIIIFVKLQRKFCDVSVSHLLSFSVKIC